MEKYLVLIDNDYDELEKLKSVVSKQAKIKQIKVECFCYDENKGMQNMLDNLICLLSDDFNSQSLFHIVIDACLTSHEHDLSTIKNMHELSGIEFMKKINSILKNKDCKYNLSLMTRFFANQLRFLEDFQMFQKDKANNFYSIIRKPILDNGEIDNGYSPMPMYTELLPEEFLSLQYSSSFEKITLYVLGET